MKGRQEGYILIYIYVRWDGGGVGFIFQYYFTNILIYSISPN